MTKIYTVAKVKFLNFANIQLNIVKMMELSFAMVANRDLWDEQISRHKS